MIDPVRITVCGLGPGAHRDVTVATIDALAAADHCYLRTERHPSADLAPSGAVTFDSIYDRSDRLDQVYTEIADVLVAAAMSSPHGRRRGGIVYAVPGSPLVLERSVRHLRADPRIDVELLPALSFLDTTWARLGIDPVEESVRLVDGHTFARDAAGERGPLLVAHTHAQWVLSDLKLAVDAGPEQRAIVLQRLGTPDESITEVAWPELDRVVEADHLTSIYLPEVTAPVGRELQQLIGLVGRLRQDCPWDRQQTHRSLRPYLLEETYEVLEALDGLDGADPSPALAGDVADSVGVPSDSAVYADLEEELGDLLFQIVFHAELAAESGEFTIADVARTVHDKLVARHPHVFGEVVADDAAAVVSNWERIKKVEKGRSSIMDGIPAALPSLVLSEQVLKKADRSGAPADPELVARWLGAVDSIDSETALGRHLLAVVETARRSGLDAESALRSAVTAARSRFVDAESTGGSDALWILG